MRGAAVNRAVVQERKKKKAHLKQLLSSQRRHSLEAIFQGDTGDSADVPAVFRERLKGAERAWLALEAYEASKNSPESVRKEKLTVNLHSLYDECRMKFDRSKRASRGGTFLLFFAFFSAALVMQRNAFRGEQVGRSVVNYFVQQKFPAPTTGPTWPDKNTRPGRCTDASGDPTPEGCQIPLHEMKGFLDIVTTGDLWDWLEHLFLENFFKTTWENGDERESSSINKWDLRNRPIQGFRFNQRRMEPGAVTRHSVDGGCWAYNDGKMRTFAPECYDHMGYCADGSCFLLWEDTRPFGTFDDNQKYTWEAFDTGFSTIYPKEKGFWQMFPVKDKEEALRMLQELKSDMWIDKSTQWFRIDFTVMNPEERLFVTLQFFFELDYSGLVVPQVVSDVYQVAWYNWNNSLDVLRFCLEIVVVLSWIVQVFYLFHDFIVFKSTHPEIKGFRQQWKGFSKEDSYSTLRNVQLFFFLAVFILWGMIVFDPFNGKLVVFPNEMNWDGKPLFLSQMAGYIRSYFVLNGVITLLFILRIIQLAKVNPKFSLLSESLDTMKFRLLNFAIVLFTLLLFFTLMGMMLFGDKVPEFSDLGAAFVSTTQILIGGGGDPDDVGRTRGGGYGIQDGVDYPDLALIAPRTAWLWYYPFVIIMVFVVINITIAIIGEAHQRVKLSRDPTSTTFVLSPSEGWHGEPTSVWHQFNHGVLNRINRSIRGDSQHAMRKDAIIRVLEKFPTKDLDWDVCHIHDFANYGAPEGLTKDNIFWIMQRYPFVVNSAEDLEGYIEERTPPSLGTKRMLEGLGSSIEDLINMQAIIHAKFDLLVRMATV